MHIAFVDSTPWDYTIETPYRAPLGGSQSALCYLAEQLAAFGHEVRLFNHASSVSVSRGVTCVPLDRVAANVWKQLDMVIVQNWAKIASELKLLMRPDAKLILWTQHACDQPAMRGLAEAEFRDSHDAFVFVSDWQRAEYERVFGIAPARSHVLRNAIGPAFERRFAVGADILASKRSPPILAYTSTPFRGLDLLLGIFPVLRQAFPGITLRIYSSMKVYQMSADKDAAQYGVLYEKCRTTPGVEYIGSLPQSDLARELAAASVLAYPNHFAETSCIAVMEAMASGCRVVTSQLGALPETTAGYGTLIRVDGNWRRYAQEFLEATAGVLREAVDYREALEERLTKQVTYINENCTWRIQAQEWSDWFETIKR